MGKSFTVAATLIALNLGGFMYAGCGGGDDSSPDQNQNDAGNGADTSTPDGSPPDANSNSDSGPADSGPFVPQTFTVSIATTLGAGGEDTQCATMHLNNTGTVHIGSLHTTIANGTSNDLVVYKVDDTVASPTPTDCRPLIAMTEADAGTALTISQNADETLQFPANDGFTLNDHQMIRLELHATNGGDVGVTITGTAVFTTMPDSAFQQEVGMVFGGTPDISLMPGPSTVNETIAVPSVMASTQLLLMSGHQHRLGTGLTVDYGSDGGGAELYDETQSWSNPLLTAFAPPQAISAGNGFNLNCTWNNTGATVVKFGESTNDEQCFFRAHYAPSAGTRVCVHTTQVPGGVDVCCPGDALCSELTF